MMKPNNTETKKLIDELNEVVEKKLVAGNPISSEELRKKVSRKNFILLFIYGFSTEEEVMYSRKFDNKQVEKDKSNNTRFTLVRRE